MDPDSATSSAAPAEPSAPAETPSSSPLPAQTADTQAPAPREQASSTDASADDRQSLLDVVRAVVDNSENPKGEDASAPEPRSSETDPTQPAQTDPLEADPSEDELKSLVPRTRKRIEKLLTQRNEARVQSDQLKPDAERWQHMHTYLVQNDLAAEDVNLLLGVGAALRRGDFKAFYDGVAPYVQLAEQHLGMAISPDLSQQVDTGEITREAAVELTQARLQSARLQNMQQQQTQASQAQRQTADRDRLERSITDAVNQWQDSTRGQDADYAAKVPYIVDFSRALRDEHGHPTSPEAAVALAKAAYEKVNRMFTSFRPQPTATQPTPSGARSVNGSARPTPKSMLDVVNMALDAQRNP